MATNETPDESVAPDPAPQQNPESPTAESPTVESPATSENPGAEALATPDQVAAPPSPPATRWRDRVFSFRSLIAVAAATLILGGLGGAGLVAVADHGDHRSHGYRHDGGPRPGDGPGFPPPGGFERDRGGDQERGSQS